MDLMCLYLCTLSTVVYCLVFTLCTTAELGLKTDFFMCDNVSTFLVLYDFIVLK